jgi:hypothetical protein
MKIETIITKLTAKGYTVKMSMNTGNVIATKGQRTYMAKSYNQLAKQLL